MKTKIFYEKKTNYTVVEYSKMNHQNRFRFHVLSQLMGFNHNIFMIDTAMMGNGQEPIGFVKSLEEEFIELGIPYRIKPGESKDRAIFNVKIGKDKAKQFKAYFELNKGQITQVLFERFFSDVDFFVGFNAKCSTETFFENLDKGYSDGIFESEWFDYTLFDSIYMSRIRLTKHIHQLSLLED